MVRRAITGYQAEMPVDQGFYLGSEAPTVKRRSIDDSVGLNHFVKYGQCIVFLNATGLIHFFLTLIASKAAAYLMLGDVNPLNLMVLLDYVFKQGEDFGRVSLFSWTSQNVYDFHDDSPFANFSRSQISSQYL